MINLYQELSLVASAFDKEKIPYALVGGIAFSVWVELRATEDIDFLILGEDWPRIPVVLSFLGYKELSGKMDFKNVRLRRLVKIVGEEVVNLDFILADDQFTEGVRKAETISFQGCKYSIASPEVIIALKEKRMSAKDRNDIEQLRKLMEGGKQ